MHFDDRLDTVLRHPISGEAVARIQYVQLLDLLGNMPGDAESLSADSAYERLLQLSAELTPAARTSLLRKSGLRFRNPRLLGFLAEDDQSLSTAAIEAADLSENEWLDLIPALPVTSRGLLRHRRDLAPSIQARLEQLGVMDRGLPPADIISSADAQSAEHDLGTSDELEVLDLSNIDAQDNEASALLEDADTLSETQEAPLAEIIPIRSEPSLIDSGIGEIVRKIEAYRKEHKARQSAARATAPHLPLGKDQPVASKVTVACFDFTTDARGTIIDADIHAAPMVIGLPLASLECLRAGTSSLPLPKALAARQPLERYTVIIDLADTVSGEWQLDAIPLFDTMTAHFTGYTGRARRIVRAPAPALTNTDKADRMRQMLHELRNPAGAIQMSSELIQQQLGGDVPHEYRAIAASIASDTALVLAGFEELDRLAKLDTHAMRIEPGETDIVSALDLTVTQIHRHTSSRQISYELKGEVQEIFVAVERGDLDRLLWRLLAAIVSAAQSKESLPISLTAQADAARVNITLPKRLRDLKDSELYHAQAGEKSRVFSAGMFGLGFTLRLAKAEAHSAGGSLQKHNTNLVLTLPTSADYSININECAN